MTLSEKFLNTEYLVVDDLSRSKLCKVELVSSTENECLYLRKTYEGNKTALFNKLSVISSLYLPRVFLVNFTDGKTVVIEEYIEGQTLEQRIAEKTVSAEMIFPLAKQLASALYSIHREEIIHRDIKPSNIIIAKSGRAYLIDFGISRFYSDEKDTDTELLGTRGYAPPEQFGFSATDYRSDIFSLGVTLDKAIASCKYRGVLCGIARQCMSLDPAKRYPSVRALKRAMIFGYIVPPTVIIISLALAVSSIILLNMRDGILPVDDTLSESAAPAVQTVIPTEATVPFSEEMAAPTPETYADEPYIPKSSAYGTWWYHTFIPNGDIESITADDIKKEYDFPKDEKYLYVIRFDADWHASVTLSSLEGRDMLWTGDSLLYAEKQYTAPFTVNNFEGTDYLVMNWDSSVALGGDEVSKGVYVFKRNESITPPATVAEFQ